jgi:hypothetical protein
MIYNLKSVESLPQDSAEIQELLISKNKFFLFSLIMAAVMEI